MLNPAYKEFLDNFYNDFLEYEKHTLEYMRLQQEIEKYSTATRAPQGIDSYMYLAASYIARDTADKNTANNWEVEFRAMQSPSDLINLIKKQNIYFSKQQGLEIDAQSQEKAYYVVAQVLEKNTSQQAFLREKDISLHAIENHSLLNSHKEKVEFYSKKIQNASLENMPQYYIPAGDILRMHPEPKNNAEIREKLGINLEKYQKNYQAQLGIIG